MMNLKGVVMEERLKAYQNIAYNKDNIDCIDLLLQHVAVNVNMKSRGSTPLDCVYLYNTSSIQEAIIALIRSYGGKRAEELRNDQR